MKKKAKKEFTYFIQSEKGGPIKIGYTTQDPNKRLRDLQVGSPAKLKLLGVIKGNKERALHHKFTTERSHGEWFEPSTKLVDYINKNIDSTVISTDRLVLKGSSVKLIDAKPDVDDGWFDHVLENNRNEMNVQADSYFYTLYSKNGWLRERDNMSYEDYEKSEDCIRLQALHENDEWHPLLPIMMNMDNRFHSIDLDYIEGGGYLDVYPYTDGDVISYFFMCVEDWDFVQKIGINIKNKQMCFMCRPIDIYNSKSNTTITAEETLSVLGSFAVLLQHTADSIGWFCYAIYWDSYEQKQYAVNLNNLGSYEAQGWYGGDRHYMEILEDSSDRDIYFNPHTEMAWASNSWGIKQDCQ